MRAAVITAAYLIHGIGYYTVLRGITVDGATGLSDAFYNNKVAAALYTMRTDNFVYLHIEGCDYAGHEGNVSFDMITMENLDRLCRTSCLKGCEGLGGTRRRRA